MPILKHYGRRAHDKRPAGELIFRRQASPTPLIQAVTLAAHCGPVKNQSTEGDCTGNSGASAVEWENRAYLSQSPILSAQDVYANSLILDGDFPQDVGSTTETTVDVLTTEGVCTEALYPSIAGKILQPTAAQIANALLYKMAGKHRLADSSAALATMANAIKPRPVLIAFDVRASFESQEVADSGIYNPGPHEQVIAGHQVLMIGADFGVTAVLRPKACPPAVLCQNSWDTDWGCIPPGPAPGMATRGFFWMARPTVDEADTDLWMLYSGQMALIIGVSGSVAPPPAGSPPGVGYQEWDANGNPVTPVGPMQYSSDAPQIASVDAQGNVKALAAGVANITATDLFKGLSASTKVTVTA